MLPVLLLLNVVGNLLAVLSLMTLLPKPWSVYGSVMGLPVNLYFLLLLNVDIISMHLRSFEYIYLTAVFLIFSASMAFCFNFDERVMVLVSWVFGSQSFLLIDAFITPTTSKVGTVISTGITILLWLGITALFSMGLIKDINDEVQVYRLFGQQLNIQFRIIGVSRMITFILFLSKGLFVSIRGKAEFRMFSQPYRAYLVSTGQIDHVQSQVDRLKHMVSS